MSKTRNNKVKKVWSTYIEQKIYTIYKPEFINEWEDLAQYAPCPWCDDIMYRAQYEGHQPNGEYSWSIDHKDGNHNNNDIKNLQPMHPWCNKEKK